MKKRTIKYVMNRLIVLLGGGKTCHDNSRGQKEVAKRLDIHFTYVWKIAKGKKKPGKHLYEAIVRLCDELEAENKENKNE